MKRNEKLLIASVLCGIVSILCGAAGLVYYYMHWPFDGLAFPDHLHPIWISRGGLVLAHILMVLIFALISLLLLAVYDRAKVARSTIVWNGGLFLFIQLVVFFCTLRFWEDIIGFVPLSSGVYFFGFAQGLILCFAKGEKQEKSPDQNP